MIQRDFERLQKEKLWGIEANPIRDDNMFEWTAKVFGLKGTPWEGGVFRLYLKFNENYNMEPPQVCFHTIPFHPNIDKVTGKPFLAILDNPVKWQSANTVASLLRAIQGMLSQPALENAVNLEASDLLCQSPHTYKQTVQDCVAASQRVEAGLVPHIEEGGKIQVSMAALKRRRGDGVVTPHVQSPKTEPPAISKVSFEDYHRTWRGIATSASNPEQKNPLLEAIKDNPTLEAVHYGLPVREIQEHMDKQLNEHSRLVYGRFKDKSKASQKDDKQAKMDKVDQMRKMYLQAKSPRKTPASLRGESRDGTSSARPDVPREPWDQEAEDLVKWTNDLNEDHL